MQQELALRQNALINLKHYARTRVSFENTIFGKRISGIETIVEREFIPLRNR